MTACHSEHLRTLIIHFLLSERTPDIMSLSREDVLETSLKTAKFPSVVSLIRRQKDTLCGKNVFSTSYQTIRLSKRGGQLQSNKCTFYSLS